MKEMNAVKLYRSITNIEDRYIEEIRNIPLKKKDSFWIKCRTKLKSTCSKLKDKVMGQKAWKVLAAGTVFCLCLAGGIGIMAANRLDSVMEGGNNGNNGNSGNGGNGSNGNHSGDLNGFWGNGDCAHLEAHRSDFSPEFSPEAEAAFADVDGVMKIYKTLNNEWFLADNLTDFSQVLMTDVFYIVPGFIHGTSGSSKDGTYGVYTLDENGEARWGMGVSVPDNGIVPYELGRLTYDIIEEDLAGIDYEDYIITQSNRLYTVFIWARCADGNDVFVTYPARPEFVGLENRGRYTLEEIRIILSQKYSGS